MRFVAEIITELTVLVFNILIFTKLTTLKKECVATKAVMYGGSALFLGLFTYSVCANILAEALASFVLVTLPTFILFYALSAYKDYRFFVTFCFLDTVTLILTFFARAIKIWFGELAGIAAYVVLCIIMGVVYFVGAPWFRQYRDLIRNVHKGWAAMAISTLLVYLLLIFAASYPVPMIERPEYLVVYALMSVTILSVYVVFVLCLAQKKALADMNEELVNEKKWHDMAYVDAVTGLKNRLAYIRRFNAIERENDTTKTTYAIMLDIDNFKKINDTFGHHTGDMVLKKSAEFLLSVFDDRRFEVFRIGGDEFAVIAIDVSKVCLEQRIAQIYNPSVDLICDFSCGFAEVDFSKKNAMENAFILADQLMYQQKKEKKRD